MATVCAGSLALMDAGIPVPKHVSGGALGLITKEGKRLQSTRITEETGNWDLSGAGLSSGIYIVLLEIRGEAVPFKLVIL